MADSDRWWEDELFPPSSHVTLSQGVASDCPLLRASNEALLRARVPRAKRTSKVAPSHPSKLACSILSRTVVLPLRASEPCWVSCPSEVPRPVLTGGAACSTFRSTRSRNGTSCCAKRSFAMASNRALALAAAARLSFHPSIGEYLPAP